MNGQHEVVHTLLQGGANVNAKDNVRNQIMITMMMMMMMTIIIVLVIMMMMIMVENIIDNDDERWMYWL